MIVMPVMMMMLRLASPNLNLVSNYEFQNPKCKNAKVRVQRA